MLRTFLLALAVVVLAIAPAHAEQVKIRIKVDPQTPMHVFDLSKSQAELTAADPHEGKTTQGITRVEFVYGYTPKLTVVRAANDLCIQGDIELVVRVGFKPPVVLIARDIEAGKCHHYAAIGHELKHVAAANETVAVLVEKAPPLFAKAASQLANACAADAEALKDVIRQRLGLAVSALAKLAEDDNRARNAAIDTPEEYRRVDQVCGRP